jgi:ATP-dependent exoDNAse (exonuclease V) beta subunit
MRTLIRASAGSGKTYALTTRYLELLGQGAEPEAILATTFTRKAAGEILHRVLAMLANRETPADQQSLAGFCRSLHRVNISTIDSFMIGLCRSLGDLLDLPDDIAPAAADDVRVQAVRRMAMDRLLTTPDDQTDAVVRALLHGPASSSVVGAIEPVVSELHQVYLDSREESLWTPAPGPRPPAPNDVATAVAVLRDSAGKAPVGRQVADGTARLADHIDAKDWAAAASHKLLQNARACGTYCRKPIPPDVLDACAVIDNAVHSVLRAEWIERTRSTYDLLRRYDEVYAGLAARARVMLFSDAPRLLAANAGKLRPDLLEHRTDRGIRHMLLDEFQDTDPAQWAVLSPFIHRCLAPEAGGSLFCVGDVKQAIYGWRGGSAEIFDTLEEQIPGVEVATRNSSYRSSQVVLDAVNAVFGSIDTATPLAECSGDLEAWARKFGRHEAVKADLPGYVALTVSPRDEGQGGSRVEACVDWVRQIQRERPDASIGILTRTNAAALQMLDALRAAGVGASAEGASALTDDPAVELILSALTMADHPGHTAAAFHVARSPLAECLGLPPDPRTHPGKVATAAARLRRQVLDHGYGRALRPLAALLAPHAGPRGCRRLSQLLIAADAFDRAFEPRPGAFVTTIDEARAEESVAAQVRVMTIHRAKGLEFDAVALPDLDGSVRGRHRSVLTVRQRPTDPVQAVIMNPSPGLRSVDPDLDEAAGRAQTQEMRENLAVLYVAMTRARHALHMFCGVAALGKATFTGIVAAQLGAEGPGPGLAYQSGDPEWWRSLSADTAHTDAAGWECPEHIEMRPATSAEPDRQAAPSSREGQWIRASAAFSRSAGDAQQQGLALHACFAAAAQMGSEAASPAAVADRAARIEPTLSRTQLALAAAQAVQALEQPGLRAALSPFKCGAGQTVETWAERDFVAVTPEGTVRGRFDHVVVLKEAGRPVRAHVADYKTGEGPAGAAAADGQAQVRRYMVALAAMLAIPRTDVSGALLYVGTGEVVDVPSGSAG